MGKLQRDQMITTEEAKRHIGKCIENWQNRCENGPFPWVDDRLGRTIKNTDFCYRFHVMWVRAWNDSGRNQEMDAFLKEWSTIDNINKVIERARGQPNKMACGFS